MITRNTQIYAAFCGTGKSYLCDTHILNCIEFECWKYREGDFPSNYIQDVISQVGKVDYIFISADPVVLKRLYARGITVKLVYPDISLKEEYMKRYVERESANDFVGWIYKSWDTLITELQQQDYCEHTVLNKNQYLQQILNI